MHMSDALISPAVGGVMTLSSAGIGLYSINKLRNNLDNKKVPLMGIMGAFVFAAQMVNFTIPGTSASGHLGGGLILAIILGPYAAFISMASILLIQALCFADGGFLAYGCNVFNLGFYTCFIAYPFIYNKITKKHIKKNRIFVASIIASIIGLQLGSFSVVIETFISGQSEILFLTFVKFMQPIHLAIGIIEGIITAAVVMFIYTEEPGILVHTEKKENKYSNKKVVIIMIVSTILIGTIVSVFASSNPDGLEWSLFNTMGKEDFVKNSISEKIESFQEDTAILPDYDFKNESDSSESRGTSISGIVGSLVVLIVIISIGYLIRFIKARKKEESIV